MEHPALRMASYALALYNAKNPAAAANANAALDMAQDAPEAVQIAVIMLVGFVL